MILDTIACLNLCHKLAKAFIIFGEGVSEEAKKGLKVLFTEAQSELFEMTLTFAVVQH